MKLLLLSVKICTPHTHMFGPQAFKMGLLDLVGLQHVGVAACKDLRWARCRCAPPPLPVPHRQLYVAPRQLSFSVHRAGRNDEAEAMRKAETDDGGRRASRYAMEPTNWALNAAQINHDIRLANELLPSELQVPVGRPKRCTRG